MISESCKVSACAGFKGQIFVNGFQFSPNTRGINIVLFDFRSGLFEDKRVYDVYGSEDAMKNLADFLNHLSFGKILLMAAKVAVRFNTNASLALQRYGVSARFATPSLITPWASMAAVAYTSAERIDWEKSAYNVDGGGVSIIETTLYLFRKSNGKDDCSNEIGVQTHTFPNSRFYAKSIWRNIHMPYKARLHRSSPGWCSERHSSVSEYLQIDLGAPKHLTGLAIQSHGVANAHHVTQFKLQYSPDGIMWSFYNETKNKIKLFNGLPQGGILITKVNWFQRTIVRVLKIIPTARVSDTDVTCLRIELYGCSPKQPVFSFEKGDGTKLPCERPMIIYYTMPYTSNVVYGISRSADIKSLASSLDLYIKRINGSCEYDNGNVETVPGHMRIISNKETKMDTVGFLEFKNMTANYYSFAIDTASEVNIFAACILYTLCLFVFTQCSLHFYFQ